MQYSNLAALQVRNGTERPMTTEVQGRVRLAVIDFKSTGTDKEILLWKAPAGRVRILSGNIKATLATPATTIKIGYGAYTSTDGQKKVADDDAFLTATASNTITALAALPPSGMLLETQTGFDVTAIGSANIAANDKIEGVILYVVD